MSAFEEALRAIAALSEDSEGYGPEGYEIYDTPVSVAIEIAEAALRKGDS